MPDKSDASGSSSIANTGNDHEIKVLLIEDNPEYAGLLKRILAKEKRPPLHLESANSLQAGLERLAQGDINVILLDLTLPDSQGFETFTRIHSQVSAVPIVILTGFDDEKLALEAVGKGHRTIWLKARWMARYFHAFCVMPSNESGRKRP